MNLRASVTKNGDRETNGLNQTIVDRSKHITELESVIKNLTMKNELPQPSLSDLAARKLVETHVKLNCNCFEIPVPLKNDVILPNNYVWHATEFLGR